MRQLRLQRLLENKLHVADRAVDEYLTDVRRNPKCVAAVERKWKRPTYQTISKRYVSHTVANDQFK